MYYVFSFQIEYALSKISIFYTVIAVELLLGEDQKII